MARYYASNNWETIINDSGGIDDSVTSVVVADSTGHPTVPFKITIDDEIMNVTNVTSNTLTIVRGQESTIAASHEDGAIVENRPTAGVWNDLWDDFTTHENNTTDAHGIDDYLPLAGGTMTGDINCNGNEIQKPQLEAYTETIVSSIHSAAGDLTLDLATGNHFKVTVSANITGIILSNAASADTNSITIEFMPTGVYSITWLDTVSVIDTKITISVDDTDNSFNDSASGFSNVEVGDLINVTGFTEAANNDSFRVTSVTTSKIIVADSTEGGADLTTEIAGDSVTITRDALYGDTPDVPDIYKTLVVTLWSSDGDRFKLVQVGEF